MNATPTIVHADGSDAGTVAALVAEAFHALDAVAWLVPEDGRRNEIMTADFRIYLDHAMKYGEVHVTADRSAAAVWFPRDGEPPPEPANYEERVAAACGAAAERFLLLDALLDENHPVEPHHHLAFLAVSPDRQGAGLGSALLRHHHDRLDAGGVAAYLEASSTRSRDLYLRHGYQVGEPFRLPDDTPFWPMWRPAQPVGQ